MNDIPENLRELVSIQLMDDETIQWIDQPIPYYFRPGSAVTFGFGIFIVVSCFVFLYTIIFAPGPEHAFVRIIAFVIGVLVLLYGLLLISVPLLARRQMERTVYVVTNFRAIIVRRTSATYMMRSCYPKDFLNMFCKQKNNGTGDLYFPARKLGCIKDPKGGFMNIRNVREVERMLQELKRTKPSET